MKHPLFRVKFYGTFVQETFKVYYPMPCYFLRIEYHGRPFHGWQKQRDIFPTGQEVLEKALLALTQEVVTTYASGRTDQGVHARYQGVHFVTKKSYPLRTLRLGLNAHLKSWPLAVAEAYQMTDTFHARFSAQKRSYIYRILAQPSPPVLVADTHWWIHRPLDVTALDKALALYLGTWNFSLFRSAQCQSASPIKTLDQCTLTVQGPVLAIAFQARSFLHHQIRMLVGGAIEVALHRWTLQDLRQRFQDLTCTKAPKAPAQGLCFLGAAYNKEDIVLQEEDINPLCDMVGAAGLEPATL